MEYCEGGDLLNYIDENGPLGEELTKSLMQVETFFISFPPPLFFFFILLLILSIQKGPSKSSPIPKIASYCSLRHKTSQFFIKTKKKWKITVKIGRLWECSSSPGKIQFLILFPFPSLS